MKSKVRLNHNGHSDTIMNRFSDKIDSTQYPRYLL